MHVSSSQVSVRHVYTTVHCEDFEWIFPPRVSTQEHILKSSKNKIYTQVTHKYNSANMLTFRTTFQRSYEFRVFCLGEREEVKPGPACSELQLHANDNQCCRSSFLAQIRCL